MVKFNLNTSASLDCVYQTGLWTPQGDFHIPIPSVLFFPAILDLPMYESSECVCVVDVATSSKLTTVKKETKEIWTEDEVTAGAEFDDVDDPRQQPQYVLSVLLSSASLSYI